MAQRKLIVEELEALNSIKDLAESYEEIAAMEMQRIKSSVLRTRGYLVDLSDVFVDLKASYIREVDDLLEKRKKGDKSLAPLLQKRGKNLMVYLSSNGKLYGPVTQQTFKLFSHDLKKHEAVNADVAIIGSAGKEMYDGARLTKPYEYFEIPDTKVDISHIKRLMNKFLQYENVHVYYGKFGNVVKQAPAETSITGEDIFETEGLAPVAREDRFIFEPTLEKIFHFFETQIMTNLFSQTLLENQLARDVSRVNAMEQALLNIEEQTKVLNRLKIRLRHALINKKQLETISGAALWET